ncbi:hypothetical protein C0J45_11985 [Silurus meridionalis]|nr:hypothetical protein C0J45_11985 [Silurus meridionalis]
MEIVARAVAKLELDWPADEQKVPSSSIERFREAKKQSAAFQRLFHFTLMGLLAQQLDNDIPITKQPKSPSQEQCNSSILESESLTVEQSKSLMVEPPETFTVEQPESLTKKSETLYKLNLVSLSSPCSPNSLSPSSSTTSLAVLTSHSSSPPPSLPCSRSLQQRKKRTKSLISSLPPSATTVSPPSFITTDLSLPQSCPPTAPSSTSQSLSQEGPYVKKGRKGSCACLSAYARFRYVPVFSDSSLSTAALALPERTLDYPDPPSTPRLHLCS